MNIFNYKVVDNYGRSQQGILEANNIKLAADYLRDQGYYIIKLENHKKRFSLSDRFQKVNIINLSQFNKQLSVMLKAGIPLIQALEIVEKQTENSVFSKTLHAVKENLRAGKSFHESLEKHPNVFDGVMINMIAAGELGGVLDELCERLAEHYQREYDIQEKIKVAMTYPVFVLVFALISIFLMMILVMPIFAGMLAGMNVQLPLLTKIVLNAGYFLQNSWFFLVLVMFFLFLFANIGVQSTYIKKYIDKIKIKAPILGDLNRKNIVARFCRILGILLTAGLPILQALDISKEATGNILFIEDLEKIKKVVIDGKSLALPFLKSEIFPSMMAHMIKVGEESAVLDKLLIELSDFYQKEVDMKIDKVSSLIEPVMIIVVGIIIGVLVLAMLLPIFQVITLF